MPAALSLIAARVHIDGFLASPRKYLLGLWWRVLGKRLRSRSVISPLLGRSPLAYRLWIERNAGKQEKDARPAVPPIRVIVDASDAGHLLTRTLSSLDEPGEAVVVDNTGRISGTHGSLKSALATCNDRGAWLMFLRAGDTLCQDALATYSRTAAHAEARLIYADDDLIDAKGHLSAPHLKPRWNEELFRHHDFLSCACILKPAPEVIDSASADGDWIADVTRKVAASTSPLHIASILHHRFRRSMPVIPTRSEPRVEPGAFPKVAVIIPTRNGADLLRTCLDGLAATDYPNLEVIIVDNDSDDPDALNLIAAKERDGLTVIRHAGAFNYSAINNAAVRATEAPVLCFLNNDIEIITPDWLQPLVEHALRDGIGAVGPMLLYPDGSVQHAGVVLGVGGGAGHAHRNVLPDMDGYFSRHRLPQFVSAVTGACLVVQRRHFDFVGGFDERDFPVAFNDVDLCLKLTTSGYKSLFEPRVRLVHHESKTRGSDRDKVGARRLAGELRALKAKWGTDTDPDPYHHPSLSRYSEQFVLDL